MIGDLNADLILHGRDVVPQFGQVEKLIEHGLLTVGGSAGITACAASALGLRTACVGVLGHDPLGFFMRSSLQGRGIDISGCVSSDHSETGISVILAPAGGDGRAILTAPGSLGDLSADHVNANLLARARHLHCTAYFIQPRLWPGAAALFDTARAAGLTCSIDTNWDPSGQWDGGLKAMLPHCDLFFPNEAEAISITGASNVESAARMLAADVSQVVIKLGAQGALYRSGALSIKAAAPPAQPIDTTGAGDAFDAGFIHGHLAGWDPGRSLALAVACGTLSTRSLGGVDAQPSLREAEEMAATVALEVAT